MYLLCYLNPRNIRGRIVNDQRRIKCEKAAIPVTSALSLEIIASGSNTGTIISRYLTQSTDNMETVHTIVRCLLFTELHDRSKKRRGSQ